jgi:hypothetical protein
VPPLPLAPTALREYISVYCYNFIIQQELKKGMIDRNMCVAFKPITSTSFFFLKQQVQNTQKIGKKH